MASMYSAKVMEHFANPHNVGELPDANGVGEVGNPKCGDIMRMLFRGAITKVLLQKYSPVKAIILSALIFGIFHINPAQVVGAVLSGVLFAWLYYKTGSLVPGILIHILNNSLSVFLSLHYPDVEYTSDLLGEPTYWICLAVAVALLAVSYKVMNAYRSPDSNTLKV